MIDSLIDSLKKQLPGLEPKTAEEKEQYRYITLQIPITESIPLLAVNIDQSFLLTKPNSNFSLLGLGALLTFESAGEKRFDHIKSDYCQLLEHWKSDAQDLPTAFLAFAFDENDPMTDNWQAFPNTILTIPVILIKQYHSSQTLLVNIDLRQSCYDNSFEHIKALLVKYLELLQKSELNSANVVTVKNNIAPSYADKNSWQTLSDSAIAQIHSGKFDKLVTSRRHSLQTGKALSVTQLTRKLSKHYPGCTILSYHLSGTHIISASPERLLSLQHPNIESDAIGGTILRNDNASLPLLLQQPLLEMQTGTVHGQKLLKEHAFIVEDIYQRLAPLCSTLKVPVTPFLMKLHNLYHLESTLAGKLHNDCGLFDIIGALHPTPAVAGFPAQPAKQWLLNNENYHRGWYTGAFGWIDGQHNGELSVMLRCALFKDTQVDLFAGAGLVAESDPEIEWQETEIKMQTILEML